ncbi:hypothetical protein KY290_001184 [Solanum tuberosum]|uniref:BED-type domain-containing protein n=1 Tax=Solanum tuberosum TaxID=4113 RepID=A0ABQ7WLH4_SOLTU|nr:hypothetical protein KY290_001184 [Solanum tuberosum]
MKRPVEVEDLEDLEVQPQVKNSTTEKTQAKGNFSETSSLNNPPKKQKRTTLDNEGSGRKTSEVWDHFSEITSKVGEVKAKCKYCFKDFKWTSKNGTSNLWGHLLTKCTKYPFKSFDKKQKTLKPIKRGGTVDLEKVVYNVTEVRRAIAEFVIIDEQPFRVVEGEGFKRLISLILPNYELPSRITVARQCLKIYQEEKQKLKRLVKGQRVCITSDTWTSLQNFTYMVITAHWIDDEWKLQKKILNFFQTPDHKGETIAKAIESCLLDWGIENLLTVTLDNATANDAAITHLKGRISDWKGVIMENIFLHVRCNAHILNLIVKEGLSEQNKSISRVRNAVKYVKSSCARTTSFKSYVEKVKLDTRGLLSLDVETRWNSTYLMLNTAVKFEKAFSRMYIDDHKYFKYCLDSGGKIEHPSSEDWRDVNVFLKFLEIFYQTTLKFSSTLHVTSNTFFHELFNLQSIIVNYSKCDDSLLTGMAKKMKGKFNKYWGDFDDMNMLLFVAVVLDPRFKMKYVKFIFKNYYNSVEGCSKSTKVTDTLTSLYNHYKNSIVGTSCETVGDQTDAVSEVSVMDTSDVWQSQWEKFLEKENNNVDDKSDLDKYLEDDVEKIKDFNILTWWKASSERYPIVSRIARDILVIPTSTVASESVFSTGGRILDCYRSSLSPKTAEALVCSQQWLRSASTECKIEDLLQEMQNLEIVEKEYPDTTLSIE